MTIARVKAGVFLLEGLNSFATTFYFYYFYFFMQKRFGFDDKTNLALAALNGFVCMVAAWWGGRFAQRFGYFTALKIGFGVLALSLAVGTQVNSSLAHVMVMSVAAAGMCLTWPTLEALVSEGENPLGLQRMLGIYNVVWAGAGALAYFSGGAILEQLGMASFFLIPIGIHAAQFVLTFRLEREMKSMSPSATSPVAEIIPQTNPRPISRARGFLRMAWLTNPFAYIAINTLVAVMPGIASRLELTTAQAGFCCSVWCFARMGAFLGLWFWPGWHYKFRWLLTAYLALILTFAAVLTATHLAVLVGAQLVFGVALGLIYYSSLFYSMDVGETKGEHGGIHEAAIGLGNFAGPAIGAASLQFFPQVANNGVMAVSALLLCGLGGLLGIWRKTKA